MIDVLNEIFQACVVPLLAILTGCVVMYVHKKSKEIQNNIDSDMADKYIEILENIVATCVETTNQTYVNELKEQNAFTIAAQKEAFTKTYYNVMQLLTEEAKEVLKEVYGDLPAMIKELIECNVSLCKKQ